MGETAVSHQMALWDYCLYFLFSSLPVQAVRNAEHVICDLRLFNVDLHLIIFLMFLLLPSIYTELLSVVDVGCL